MNKKKCIIGRRKFLQSTDLTAGAFALAPIQTACTTAGKKEVSRSNLGTRRNSTQRILALYPKQCLKTRLAGTL